MENYSVQAILSAIDKGFTKAFNGAFTTMDKFESKANQINHSYSSSMASIARTASTALGTAGTAFAAYSLNASADLKALNAQFDQTFGDMADEANETVETMSKSWGMLPNAVKPAFTQFASYFKMTGQSMEESIGSSEQAMNIAADAAAFYDKNITDTSASLKGFMMGNYENGDAIGINTNQTKIATAYNAKYGGSFDDLSEAMKSSYLLEYIQDMYDLSGITGQATRESGSWEIALLNLKTAFKDLSGAIGDLFLDQVVDQMTDLAFAMEKAAKKVKVFTKEFNELDTASEKVDYLASTFSGLADVLAGFAAAAGLAAVLPAIEALSGALSALLGPASILGVILIGLGLVDQAFGDTLDSMIETVTEKGPMIITNLATSMVERLPDLMEAGTQLLVGFLTALTANTEPIIQAAGEIITTLIGGVTEAIPRLVPVALELLTTFATAVIDQLPILIEAGLDMVLALAQSIRDNADEIAGSAIEVINHWTQAIHDHLPDIVDTALEIMLTLAQGLAEYIPEIFPSITELMATIVDKIIEKLPDIIDTGWQIVLAVAEGISEHKDEIADAIDEAVEEVIQTIIDSLPSFWDLGKSVAKHLSDGVLAEHDRIYGTGVDTVAGLLEGVNSKMSSVKFAGSAVANTLLNAVKTTLHIGSPSRVMRQYGSWTSEGFILGIQDMMRDVEKTAQELASAALPNMDKLTYEVEQTAKGAIGTVVDTTAINRSTRENKEANKPATINLRLGNQKYSVFIDDIAEALGNGADINLAF